MKAPTGRYSRSILVRVRRMPARMWWRLRRWVRARAWVRKAAGIACAVVFGAVVYEIVPDVKDWLTRDDTPFRVTIETNPDHIQAGAARVGASYVVDTPIDDIGPPPNDTDSCVGRSNWAQELGAVQADTSTVHFQVDATTDEPVYITSIDIDIVDKEPPLTGVHLACPGRGAPIQDRHVKADLSDDPPTVTITSPDGTPSPATRYVVRQGEPEAFLTTVTAPTCDCLWRIILRLQVRGDDMTYTVDDDGEPFRTTAAAAATPYRWRNGHWVHIQPIGPVEPPPAIDDCPHTSSTDIEAATGTPWQLASAETILGPGNEPIEETTCVFTPTATHNPTALAPYIRIAHIHAPTHERATTHFDNLVTGYRDRESPSPVHDLGDAAYAFDKSLIAQHGVNVLLIEADGVDEPRAVTVAVGQALATRLWE